VLRFLWETMQRSRTLVLDHAQRTFERIIANLSRTFGDCNRPHETVS
jgi:hypothetical protein